MVPGIGTVSDVQVSDDGAVLVFSTERGPNAGLYVYDLTDPRTPAFLDSALVADRDPHGDRSPTSAGAATSSPPGIRRVPALLIYDITDPDRHHARGHGADSASLRHP